MTPPPPMTPSSKLHVTVATLVEQDGTLLCVEEQTAEGRRLNQPAGHVELGETPAAAAVRETWEETGHRITLTAFLGVYFWSYHCARTQQPVTYVRLAFVGEVTAHVPTHPLDTGIERYLWLRAEDILATPTRHRSPLVAQCVRDYVSGRRLPLDAVTGAMGLLYEGLPEGLPRE